MSQIETISVGLEGLERLLKNTVKEQLGEDGYCLRSFELKPYIATCVEEAIDLAQTKGVLTVRGFLSLDGENGKMLDMNMEMGLTDSQDREIADSLAGQCVVCVKLMKEQHKHKKAIVV